jgi:hypothetical protein
MHNVRNLDMDRGMGRENEEYDLVIPMSALSFFFFFFFLQPV